MIWNLIGLSRFDVISVVSTLLTVLFVNFIKFILVNKPKKLQFVAEGATSPAAEQTEVHTRTPILLPSPTARSSLNLASNGGVIIISHPPSPDVLTDEYHEDEDTLSLDNLFPCDQSEIYASKKISFIIDELIQTEVNYVNNLRKGLSNYGHVHELENTPEALQGMQARQRLLGNIEEIIEIHEQQILPMMLRNQRDLKTLFEEFTVHIEKNRFYCYVLFMINKKTSIQLRQEQREWLQQYQTEIGDKLGVDSFLVQPVQRLTRYPLLLQQFISEFYKSGIQCKPVLVAVCKLETRMRRMLDVVNQAEEVSYIEELNELNLLNLGCFKKSTELDAYHCKSRKKFRAKVFLFEHCLVCTEVRKKGLIYKQHYQWSGLDLQLHSSKCIKMFLRCKEGVFKDEFEFSASEASIITEWLLCAVKILTQERYRATQENTFSLPMDLVLIVAGAIWSIWNYL